jgi:hypothetical protein
VSDDLSIPRPTYRVPNRGPRGGIDPVFRRMLMFAGALVGVGVLIGGVSLLFIHHGGPVPVIQADPRPIKVKPENPGGMKIAGLGDDSNTVTTDTGTLAPPPEVPDPKALRAAPASAPAPAIPAPVAPTAPLVMHSATVPVPAARPVPPAAAQAAAAQPAQTEPKPAPAPAAAAHEAAAPAHATAVQLAALPTEEAARAEWAIMTRRMPDILHGHTPAYSKVERDGRLYWRVRVVGFGDVAQARAFCDRVRAKSANCSVADF